MVCCGALLSAAPSRAAVIALDYDPVYGGATFPSLRWRVSADLFVDPTCGSGNFFVLLSNEETNNCRNANTRLDNVVLYFFDTQVSDPNAYVEYLEIGTYGADSSWPYGSTDAEESQKLLSVGGGNSPPNFTFATSWSLRRQATSSVAGLSEFDFSLRMSLSFDEDGSFWHDLVQLVHLPHPEPVVTPLQAFSNGQSAAANSSVVTSSSTPQEAFDAGDKSVGDQRLQAWKFTGPDSAYVPRLLGQFVPSFVTNAVPEPGSAALVLAALLAAAAVRRRRG